MPVLTLESFAAALPRSAAVAGLDLGEKTIGIAVSDISRTIATPLITLAKGKFTTDVEDLFAQMATRDAIGLVIGLPINMDGSEGPRAQSCRAFGRNLLRLRDMPILFWDERLSSAAVNRVLIDEGDATRARRAQVVDRMAAAYILQGALDRMKSLREELQA